MKIASPVGNQYIVGQLFGKTSNFNLYECKLPDTSVGILKIGTSKALNGLLDRESYLLQLMYSEALRLEEEYKQVHHGKKVLNYQYLFPKVIESFIDPEQDNRTINILSFSEIAHKIQELVPLSHLRTRERVRLDPKTSAWVLGKLLVALVFTRDQCVALGKIVGDNILLNREQHIVSLFDWSSATINVTSHDSSEEIAAVAREVQLALGADPMTGKLPESEQLVDDRYEAILKHLAEKGETNAKEAHKKFYEVVRSLWPRGFYPFTTHTI